MDAQVHRSGASPNPDLKRSQPLSDSVETSAVREALTFVCEALTHVRQGHLSSKRSKSVPRLRQNIDHVGQSNAPPP